MHSPLGLGSLLSNTIANSRGDLKVITTRSGVYYDGPTIPPTSSPLSKEVEREPEATKDKVQTTSSRSTAYVQPSVIQVPIPEPNVAPKPNPKPFADALLHIPKFASTFKSLLSNKEKLFELANTSLNENCSAVLLKKLPKQLRDPDKLFLRTARALIDVHGEELTLRVNDEAITFNVGHTSRYSYRYNYTSVNRIDVIDITCEEYAQEVLRYSGSSKSSNSTPSLNPIIVTSSPSLTPLEGGDFILEEIEACLTKDLILSGIDDADFDLEGDILLLDKLLNDDLLSPLPPKELHFEELKIIKSSIDDPLELELKDLPYHLEYAFLEETYKLPVIIAKNLKDEEKACLFQVLKSYKRAIAWKISDIKGIDPQFCTHKILMEDDFKPAVKHQRRDRTSLVDVYGEELTLSVDDEAITFKVGQTSKYSYSDAESINQIDVIDVACEEYVQE
nr:reverse transcriptase domain-containing protein [Tanacetum cinerariifolium]